MAGLRERHPAAPRCTMPRGRPALAPVWAPSAAWSTPVAGDGRRETPGLSMARAPPRVSGVAPHNQTYAAD